MRVRGMLAAQSEGRTDVGSMQSSTAVQTWQYADNRGGSFTQHLRWRSSRKSRRHTARSMTAVGNLVLARNSAVNETRRPSYGSSLALRRPGGLLRQGRGADACRRGERLPPPSSARLQRHRRISGSKAYRSSRAVMNAGPEYAVVAQQ